MSTITQILSIFAMCILTYVAFLSFGSRRKNLLFTKEEKEEWDKSLSKGIGKWFTLTNIVGTLTSLATVYLFFIGNSKLFGWVVFTCAITIWTSSFVTNFFTKKILSDQYIKSLFETKNQIGGVIATLFWRPDDNKAKLTSKIVKWLSLLNIVGVIWLEFALFSDIASRLFSIDAIYYKILLIFTATFVVIFFTVKYGLRGFVFADAFQSPIIAISALALVIGCLILAQSSHLQIKVSSFFQPILSPKDCILFGLHVIFLNLFLVLVTEGHWLRLWIFGKREIEMQVKSLLSTSIIWLLLILVGLFSYQLSNANLGENAIVGILERLNSFSSIFIVFFWFGGVAALFSAADAQIYSFLLVNEFDTAKGKLTNKLMDKISPLLLALMFSVIFTLGYFIVRKFQLNFEKIVFIIVPLSLNLLPAFVRAAKHAKQMPVLNLLSILLYIILSVLGIFKPADEFSWTLAAALMPILLSIIAFIKK
jgi:hypothetical protein